MQKGSKIIVTGIYQIIEIFTVILLHSLDINENSEDELSNLKNELYKITIMLKEKSEISRQDKENIKMSVEDISHQLKTPLTSIMIMLDNLKDNPNMDEDTKDLYLKSVNKLIG